MAKVERRLAILFSYYKIIAGHPGPEKHSVVSVRFKIEETDRMLFPLPFWM